MTPASGVCHPGTSFSGRIHAGQNHSPPWCASWTHPSPRHRLCRQNHEHETLASRLSLAGALGTLLLAAAPAHAETVEVKMLNRGANGAMVYEPDFVKIKPGDTVKFLASAKGTTPWP